MTILKVDELISKLQAVKESIGDNAMVALTSDDALGGDRYGVGYGLIAADAETMGKLQGAEDSGRAFPEADFKKVVVVEKDYCGVGCIY